MKALMSTWSGTVHAMSYESKWGTAYAACNGNINGRPIPTDGVITYGQRRHVGKHFESLRVCRSCAKRERGDM